jgi:hypothetical protein
MPDIFLSHKSKDAKVAGDVKAALEKWFNATVFLSSDAQSLRGGARWRDEIHSGLKRSRWLVMLYTDARENWDWCIYEAAYFLGHHADLDSGKLTILHPEGATPPVPFGEWEWVKAAPSAVKGWLENAFPQRSEPQTPTPAYDGAAKEIATAVQNLAVRPWIANRLLKVHVSASEGDKGAKDPSVDVMLNRANFKVDAGAGFILGDPGEAELEGTAFRQTLDACHFDLAKLLDTVNAVRERAPLPSQTLDLFRSTRDHRGYRPVITRTDRSEAGDVDIELMLAEIPPTFEFESATGFDTLFHLLAVTARFRWEVVEAFAAQIAAADTNTDSAALLYNLLRAVQNVQNDAYSRGLSTLEKILSALPNENHQRRIRAAQEFAGEALKILEKAVKDNDAHQVSQILLLLRLANHEYLDVIVAALSGLVKTLRLPPTEDLEPGMENKIPNGIRRRLNRQSFSGHH